MRYKTFRLVLVAGSALGFASYILPSRPAARQSVSSEAITRPMVPEDISPLEPISPVARDGHRGQGFLRKPPGAGPFPALVWIHGGLTTRPLEELKQYAFSTPNPSRFLAAGYVVAVITYRSRDEDPQSRVSFEDSLAAVNHVRQLPFVDSRSVLISGCSGGGDLALEIAAATNVAAIAAEEPASILFTGIYNRDFPKKGERFTPEDGAPISVDPKRYYTEKYQKLTRDKIRRINSPILIVQGDQTPLNRFNAQVLIPELRAAGKSVDVITYPGEPHCFAFYGSGPRTPHPAAALKAFHDSDMFFRRHLKTLPKPLDATLLKYVPALF